MYLDPELRQSICPQLPEVFKGGEPSSCKQQASTMELVLVFVDSPLAFFKKTEAPERDPTWLQFLPTESFRHFMTRLLDLAQGMYQPEIRGALASITAVKYILQEFQ